MDNYEGLSHETLNRGCGRVAAVQYVYSEYSSLMTHEQRGAQVVGSQVVRRVIYGSQLTEAVRTRGETARALKRVLGWPGAVGCAWGSRRTCCFPNPVRQ